MADVPRTEEDAPLSSFHAVIRLLRMRGLGVVVLLVAASACAEVDPPERLRPPAALVTSFDGLGAGFEGPQGSASFRNPSDNSLAVGRNHIVQIVNSHTAIFTKEGRVLYGPVETRNVFRDFGGPCEQINNGDAVVRYDQLADRWLIVMPIFRRVARDFDVPAMETGAVNVSMIGRLGQPGEAVSLFQPPPPTPEDSAAAEAYRQQLRATPQPRNGTYAMCYAVSATPDPLGAYYRYEFIRPLFPDYPRPAVWPDGYYVPTSTGDDVIEKHACVADRLRMLQGLPATEQCVIIPDVNFLNNADLDGKQPPPDGAPNIMMATGGSQLNGVTAADAIYAWTYAVDWQDPANTRVEGPVEIAVEPYRYLCGGQLTECVPQPGVDQRLDAQGDKLMARLVYRRFDDRESIVAAHSVATNAAGGVRWYEFRLDDDRTPMLYQQGTHAPDSAYRWLPSPAMDGLGNIAIGYSFGSADHFPGQRFSGRLDGDPLGWMTLEETILVDGQAAQTTTLRWEDYTQTAIDPSDDCTIWYVGDYLKEGAETYSTRIGAFRMPGCWD